MKDNKIKEKAAKILALLNNAGTEGEAVAASLALQRLLLANGLTMADVEVRQEVHEVRDDGTEWKSRYDKWELALASVIAENYRCEILRSSHKANPWAKPVYSITFIGQDEDAGTAVGVFNASRKAALRCLRSFKKDYVEERCVWDPFFKFGTAQRNSYLFGFCSGLAKAYKEQVEENEELALAVIVPKAVKDECSSRASGHVRQRYSQTSSDPSIRQAGYADGFGVGRGNRVCA